VRITAAGVLDTTFGPGDPSKVEAGATPIGYWCPSASQILEPGLDPSEGGSSIYAGLLLQPDRRIVAVGTMGEAETGGGNWAVIARYYD
jgi:hypothetical protein